MGRVIQFISMQMRKRRCLFLICILMNITSFSFQEDAVVDIGVEHTTEDANDCK